MSCRLESLTRRNFVLIFLACLLLVAGDRLASAAPAATASENLRLSCSAQVYEALRGEYLESFREKTGISVVVDVLPSWAAVSRLANRVSDLAATAERLPHRYKLEGMVEFPFCRDALVVITHIQNPIRDLSEEQLRDVFSGAISNWNEIGGPDLEVRVISPGRDTAAYKMFSAMVMHGTDIDYYLLTAQSTVAANVTRRFKGAISFVNQGAIQGKHGAAHIVKVEGLGPSDPGYPYYEIFSLVTSGSPTGLIKQFVDFAFSDEGRNLIAARGMRPIGK
jgi:phosphate transport system substrate-binding protein